MKPKVCVIRTDGTNCDRETKRAFDLVGGNSEIVHINSLREKYDSVTQREVSLDDYHILAIPGGFSKGDYIRAGKSFAQDLRKYLGEEVQQFIDDGKLVIGICNGFQVLVQAGFLPGNSEEQTVTLTYNDSQRFEDRWVRLKSYNDTCIWTKGVNDIEMPVAHGEGKFVADESTIKDLFEQGQVVYQYADQEGNPTMKFPDNPNGSYSSIAGICDKTGRILGLMPHPERYNHPRNHPLASLQEILGRDYIDLSHPCVADRLKRSGDLPHEGLGLQIFRNGIDYVVENLL
ncbi:phosphoribosylformylglycinamidine synthase I [Candidatus Woesearchaeota archaeon B3_Woes]|nr:MAG: phosphoribosylformylglycinamidine synthase I [Candidatus Woesearchaeota archaeon B3_Woes]